MNEIIRWSVWGLVVVQWSVLQEYGKIFGDEFDLWGGEYG